MSIHYLPLLILLLCSLALGVSALALSGGVGRAVPLVWALAYFALSTRYLAGLWNLGSLNPALEVWGTLCAPLAYIVMARSLSPTFRVPMPGLGWALGASLACWALWALGAGERLWVVPLDLVCAWFAFLAAGAAFKRQSPLLALGFWLVALRSLAHPLVELPEGYDVLAGVAVPLLPALGFLRYRHLTRGDQTSELAHDLKNLLHTILVGSERLGDGESADPRSVEAIRNAARRGDRLVRGLCDGRSGEDGACANVAEAVAQAVALAFPPGEGKVKVTSACAPAVMAEVPAEGLVGALVNLLSNAREALLEGGEVRVTSRVAERDAKQVALISVEDDGPGLPEGLIPFAKGATTKPGGHGLGLWSVMNFARNNLGSAEYEKVKNSGARFTLTLPARSATFLVADSDDAGRAGLVLALKLRGARVLSARTLADAQRLLAGEGVDFVVTGLCLEDSGGRALLEFFSGRAKSARVVVYSHGLEETAMERARALGARYCVPKNISPADLAEGLYSAGL